MPDAGNWTPVVFANAGPPAIDEDALNDIEDWIDMVDEEIRKSETCNFRDEKDYYYERNIKEIDNMTAASEWTADASTTVSNDTTHNVIGLNAVKFAESNDVASWIGMERAITSIDLTKFHDGSISTTNDIIMILFYVDDITKFTTFQLKLGNSNAKNYGNAWNPAGFSNEWNVRFLAKSAFGTTGAPDWSDIDYLRLDAFTTVNASGRYFTIQYIQMIRVDALYPGYPSAFQQYFGSVSGWITKYYDIHDLNTILYDERINALCIMHMIAENTDGCLLLYENCQSFQSKFEIVCKYAGYTASILWEYDVDNCIEVFISNDIFYINAIEAGVPTSTSIALDNALLANEKIVFLIEKDIDTIRAMLIKNGEQNKILEYETSITDLGNVFLGCQSDYGWSLLTDFVISNNQANLNMYNELRRGPKLYQLNEELSYVNNTITAIPDFLIRLAPNKLYMIDVYVYASAGSTNPDVKIDWNYSGVSLIGQRQCIGGVAVTASTEPSVDNNVRTSSSSLTGDIRYALNTYGCLIIEHFLLKTVEVAAYIQMRAAQYITDAGNPTVFGTSSHIIVTEVFK